MTARAIITAAIITATMTMAAAGWATPVSAQPQAQVPVGTGAHLLLREQTAFVAPTDTLTMRLEVRGAPVGALLSFGLSLSISADQLDQYVAGRGTNQNHGTRFITLADVPPNADGTVSVRMPIASSGDDPDKGFSIDDKGGVYPLTVKLLTADKGQELDRFTTYLIRVPAAPTNAAPLPVATVVPLAAPLALQPDGVTIIDPADRSRLAATVALLSRHASVPLTVRPRPETVAAVGHLETAPPVPGPELPKTDQIARALGGRQLIGGAFVDLDVNAWSESGMTDELRRQLDLGSSVLAAWLDPPRPPDRHTWFAESPPTAAGLATLAGLGIDRVVLPVDPAVAVPANSAGNRSGQSFGIDTTGGPVQAVGRDRRLSDRLTATDNPVLNAQVTLADLSLRYFANTNTKPGRGVVLDVPGTAAALDSLDTVLSALAAAPPPGGAAVVQPVDLDSLFAAPPTISLPPSAAGAATSPPTSSMGLYPENLAATQRLVSGFRSMAGETSPDRLTALDQLLDASGADAPGEAGRQAYLDAVAGSVRDDLAHINTPDQELITLTSSQAQIRIRIENALSYPVYVRMSLVSPQLEFPDGSSVPTRLEPGFNNVDVNVSVRSSGKFTLDVRVLSPDGNMFLASTQFPVRSFVVSGIGLLLSIGAGFFLLVWWVRNFRSARRSRQLVGNDAESALDTSVGGAVDVPVGAG